MAEHAVSDFETKTADWSSAYSDYLTRSTAQSIRTLKLYQEILESVSQGRLAPTVFQDRFARFTQLHAAEYTNQLAELGASFLSGLVQIGAAYSQEPEPGIAEPEIRPPQFDPADPIKWSRQLAEYAGQLNARALKAYRTQLDRVAAGESTPSQVQQVTSDYLANRLPGYLQHASRLYFDLLNGLNEIRANYEQDYFQGVLATVNPQQEPPLVLSLSAPLGGTASASLAVANSTEERTAIQCTVTEMRRDDAVGPAFVPEITITPDGLNLEPGQEGALRLSVRVDEAHYDPAALYTGTLYITGQGDVPAEVLLRITATHPATHSATQAKGTP